MTCTRRAALIGLASTLACPSLLRAQDLPRIRAVLNFAFDGAVSPYLQAMERGWFREAGLDVQIDPSTGSGDAINRTGSGAYQIGVADIATLVEFASRHPDAAPRAVFLLQNSTPMAVISLRAANIEKPRDLHGKVVGGGAADATSRMFPAFMQINGVDAAQVTRRQVTPQLRDTMLLTRQVDAVAGFDLTVWFNLKAQGLKAEDVRIMRFSDHGLAGYGNAVLAGQPLLRQNPEAVRRFVAVCNRAWREAARDPVPAIASLRRLSSLADPVLERERLEYVLQNHVLTEAAQREGIGTFNAERLRENIRVVVEGFGLSRTPAPEEIYDGSFMPPRAERMPA